MEPTLWTGAHDRLVADTTPPVPEPSSAELESVWAQVARVVEADDDPRRARRARARIGVAAGIGAVVLGTSGLAAADLYTARTGRGPVDAEDLRLGGPGESLQLAAPDYGKVVAEETRDIPFPSAESRELAIRQQVRDVRFAERDEFVSTGAVRAWVARSAVCRWSNQWAVATRGRDEAARDEAIGMIQDAPSWPAVTAIDPEPFSRVETQQVDDGRGNVSTERYRDESLFFYLGALGDAVEGRDPAAVARVLLDGNGSCRSEDVPDFPLADPMRADPMKADPMKAER